MNVKILFLPSFKRAYKKLTPENQDRIDAALSVFARNPFDIRLRNHKLAGSQSGLRSISAGFDLRIIYVELDKHVMVGLIDVGTHDKVY